MSQRTTPAPWPPRDADHLLVSGSQMAALEEQLFASGLPVEALMEKAALAVSRRLIQRLARLRQPGVADPGVIVLVGPGHNGGDGLVVARELHLAGHRVRLWCPFERLRPLTEAHARHAAWLGIPRLEEAPDPGDHALWVDALFGIGQSRPPGPTLEALLAERQRQRPHQLVAIDIPTGLCADSGRCLGEEAATSGVTYTIGLIKQGLVQDRSLARVGRLERIDLGLPPHLLETLPVGQPLGLGGRGSGRADVSLAPWPVPDPAAGKYGRGRLLVVAGSLQYRGAARMALAGAAAAGCGSLRAMVPAELAAGLWALQPEVVLERSPDCDADGALRLEGLDPSLLERLDVVLLGPGIGHAADSPAAATARGWEALERFGGLVVLDADGLNRLAAGAAGVPGESWLRRRGGPTWLTPHRQEFARLFPDLAVAEPQEAAASAAARTGCSVLLKGARSVVAAPDGRRWQLLRACPEAARAGLGDVLAGYAAGLGGLAAAAGGGGDAQLLALAALVHARAGQGAARRWGPGGATPLAVAASLADAVGK
ncbi:NAD(P)H-hydrate dehydratase [Cyanobium sp. FGCU-52]|nr:NAD(P)H-hydrate dehydratase [Cyanobium sp. FGCU52]